MEEEPRQQQKIEEEQVQQAEEAQAVSSPSDLMEDNVGAPSPDQSIE